MRRLALVLACGALWLILAAVPALADGGPHVMTSNNGSLGINADGCAGCHRAHTAQGPFLINAADETALCLTCHGDAVTGATTDVMTGIQYALAGRSGATQLGALRGGGFDQARIGSASVTRIGYLRSATDVSFRTKVPVVAAQNVTSSHLDLDGAGGVVTKGTVWGNGDNSLVPNTGAALVELSCASCHNPHGNGQYRILNPIPEADATGFDDAVAINVASTDTAADIITAERSHDLQIGDLVKLTGVGGLSNTPTYTVVAIPNGIQFQVGSFNTDGSQPTVLNVTTGGAAGSFVKASRPVTDAPLPTAGDARNYTVIQTKGGQGVDASYLLYASQVAAAASGGNFAAMPAVNIASISALTDRITTAAPHGLSVGDRVTITGQTGITDGALYTVSAVSFAPYPSETGTPSVYSPTVFTIAGLDITADAAGNGTVSRNAIPGTYGPTGGDYLHRTAPWNPALVNTQCSQTVFNSTNSARCGAANDAPNGQPDTITAGPLAGEISFSTQITAWCTGCHTRYYADQNANPGGEPGTSAATSRNIAATDIASRRITTTASHGFQVGDVVSIAGNASVGANGNYTVETVPTSVTFTLVGVTPATTSTVAIASSDATTDVFTTSAAHGFVVGDKVTISGHNALPTNVNSTYAIATATPTTFTLETIATTPTLVDVTFSGTAAGTVSKNVGTAIRFSDPQTASSWWFDREDGIYKFQHRTVPNRACVTCHVSHGSNAQMTGTFSSTYTYPNGTVSNSSRLLKIDNRGTCQACHDPTETSVAGGTVGPAATAP